MAEQHEHQSRGPERRALARWSPEINLGHVLQVGVLILGFAGAYGTYTADKAADRAEVAQIKRDAESQRQVVKEALGDIKGDVKEIQRALIGVNESLAVLKARPEQQPAPPTRTR